MGKAWVGGGEGLCTGLQSRGGAREKGGAKAKKEWRGRGKHREGGVVGVASWVRECWGGPVGRTSKGAGSI